MLWPRLAEWHELLNSPGIFITPVLWLAAVFSSVSPANRGSLPDHLLLYINTVTFKRESVLLHLSLLVLSPSGRRGVQVAPLEWVSRGGAVRRGCWAVTQQWEEFSTPRTAASAHWVGMGLAKRCYSYCCYRMLILPFEPSVYIGCLTQYSILLHKYAITTVKSTTGPILQCCSFPITPKILLQLLVRVRLSLGSLDGVSGSYSPSYGYV